MNHREVTALLTYISSIDSLMSRADPDLANLRANAWSKLLDEVPLDWARGAVERWYGTERGKSISPGELRDQWRRTDLRRRQQLDEPTVLAESFGDAARQMGAPPWFREAAEEAAAAARWVRLNTDAKAGTKEWREAMDAATERAVAEVRARYGPAGENRPVPDALAKQWQRERHCGNNRCGCTHTNCRAGFLDLDEKWSWYESQTRRCSRCAAHLPESA